jgi:hypothetical protein
MQMVENLCAFPSMEGYTVGKGGGCLLNYNRHKHHRTQQHIGKERQEVAVIMIVLTNLGSIGSVDSTGDTKATAATVTIWTSTTTEGWSDQLQQ